MTFRAKIGCSYNFDLEIIGKNGGSIKKSPEGYESSWREKQAGKGFQRNRIQIPSFYDVTFCDTWLV